MGLELNFREVIIQFGKGMKRHRVVCSSYL